MCEGEKEKVEGWHARPIKGCKTSRPPPSWALDGNCKAAHLLTTARLSYKKPQCSCAKHDRCECARGRAQVCECTRPQSDQVRPSLLLPTCQGPDAKDRHQGGGDHHKFHLDDDLLPLTIWKGAAKEGTPTDSARVFTTRGDSMGTTKE